VAGIQQEMMMYRFNRHRLLRRAINKRGWKFEYELISPVERELRRVRHLNRIGKEILKNPGPLTIEKLMAARELMFKPQPSMITPGEYAFMQMVVEGD
jgi:hypothetical protein